jgi:hypothetical protein
MIEGSPMFYLVPIGAPLLAFAAAAIGAVWNGRLPRGAVLMIEILMAAATVADLAAESSGIDWPAIIADRFGT